MIENRKKQTLTATAQDPNRRAAMGAGLAAAIAVVAVMATRSALAKDSANKKGTKKLKGREDSESAQIQRRKASGSSAKKSGAKALPGFPTDKTKTLPGAR